MQSPRFVDIACVEKCRQHQHNIIIYYCNIHDEIGCSECMSTTHRACATECIGDIAQGTKDCIEYTTLLEDLAAIKIQAEENEKKAVENKLNSDICLSTVMRDIRTFRHDIDARLDQMELTVSNKAKEVNLEYQIEMNEIVTESKNIQENAEELLKEIKGIEAKETKLFIKMKQKRVDVSKYKHGTERDKVHRMQSFTFEPNSCVADIFRTSESLGKLLVNNLSDEKGSVFDQAGTEENIENVTEDSSEHDVQIKQDMYVESKGLKDEELGTSGDTMEDTKLDKEVKGCDVIYQRSSFSTEDGISDRQETNKDEHGGSDELKEIEICVKGRLNAKLFSDKEDCDISGMDMLSENEIVLADYNNRSIKVVDIIQNKITDEIKLEYHPYDLTVPDTNTVAVTLTNTIQMIAKSHLLRLGDSINVDGECYGIASSRTKFFVSFIKPNPKVEILNHQGDVLQKLEMDTIERRIFKRPRYIDVSPDEKFIYISDFETDSIIRLSAIDKQTNVFTDATILNGPYGIHVGENGHVLVCNYGNDNIFEFSADLSKHKMVLSQTEGVESPQSIYMCNKENKLFVACTDSADCNDIQIFSRSSR
ncbi:uncharacterized protein LOC128549347 [Mercenaria mercenaria]|uniref:uncharacterized protein LOC128549347 n=1 Tax=Mercenaria mercenaria TaxID=6596 RepID=UPI00234F2D48|nr:uncharacterized protein LOC128549347 [Mercenaria mercenaria]